MPMFPVASTNPPVLPTISPQPTSSRMPAGILLRLPTRVPTEPPSKIPSASPWPSAEPSHSPSDMPTISFKPSHSPTTSPAPTNSHAPTQEPSSKPTLTPRPSPMLPSSLPSSFPSTPFPTVSPTPLLDTTFTQRFLYMQLSHIPRNATFAQNDGWRRLTTEHVRFYWRSFGASNPIYIGRVVTIFSSEKWEAVTLDPGMVEEYGTLTIQYSQEIMYRRRTEVDPYPGFQQSDICTIPFQQNPLPYTTSLATLFNNTITTLGPFIFIEDSGLSTDPSKRTEKEVTTIAVTVTLVSLALIVATACVLYQIHFKHRKGIGRKNATEENANANTEPPMVGTVIGINPNDNVLISESYDEELDMSENLYAPSKGTPQELLSDPNEGDQEAVPDLQQQQQQLPLQPIPDNEQLPKGGSDNANEDDDFGGDAASDLMAAPGEDGAFPTLSSSNNSNNPDEVRMLGLPLGGDSPLFLPYRANYDGDGNPMGKDIHSSSMADISPLLGSSPPRRMPDDGLDGGLEETEESTIPFMGFPMEIHDLE